MTVADIRFKHLGYLALNVSDLNKSRTFYEELVGLKIDEAPADGLVFLRCSQKHHDILLVEGGEPGLKRVGWELEDAKALKAAREHLAEIGLKITEVPAEESKRLGVGEAFRFVEPTAGMVFEFYHEMKAAPAPFEPTHTRIARLGHLVVGSPDRVATETFLMDHLNFRVSDRIKGLVSFMRAFPNPYHHSFGVATSGKTCLNHINFMVTVLDDVGSGNNRMKKAGVPITFGPGKHPPSESVFLYFLDPDGLTVEYSYGMEEFPEEMPREAREMPPVWKESVDYWDGVMDPQHGKKGVVESSEV